MNVAIGFTEKLAALKTEIDAELGKHAQKLRTTTARDFTPYSVAAVDAYTQILSRGGKRIRGALTVVGYEMCGGNDREMILQAACAIEMTHAYILVLDDIMDKSAMRRGGPSAHTTLTNYHRQHGLGSEGGHFGEAVAINAGLIGCHYAQGLVARLHVSDAYKLNALQLLNDALVVTGHGQINDIFNEVVAETSERAVDQVFEWKTAHYTFLNPLQFGMALAGVTGSMLAAVTEYCMQAGRAFQITDDILGTFGSEQEAGKSPMDDIREGKRTLLSVVALQKAQNGDKNFLIQMLGNAHLTQAEFARCKEIFESTGALTASTERAAQHIAQAKRSLNLHQDLWAQSGNDFLNGLTDSMLGRTA